MKALHDVAAELATDLQEASAAFRADYLHHRLTGATVVLHDDSANELAEMLLLASRTLSLLLTERSGGAA